MRAARNQLDFASPLAPPGAHRAHERLARREDRVEDGAHKRIAIQKLCVVGRANEDLNGDSRLHRARGDERHLKIRFSPLTQVQQRAKIDNKLIHKQLVAHRAELLDKAAKHRRGEFAPQARRVARRQRVEQKHKGLARATFSSARSPP